MRIQVAIIEVFLYGLLISTAGTETELSPRSYTSPLPVITLVFDGNNTFEEAFVSFKKNSEGWAIGAVDDRYVKDTRHERIDQLYRELPTASHYVSPFEAKVINQVTRKFEEALVIYERDLKHGSYERLLYLDGQLPSFLRGFFYMYCAAHNSFSALPKVTRIADSLYEETTPSLKSDQRVRTWRSNPEHVVKLRIATKELIFQMNEWRTKTLTGPAEFDPRQDKSKKFRESYELFIRLYFNLPPASVLKKKIF